MVKADLLRGHRVSVTEEVTIHLLLSIILLRMDSVCELEPCRGGLSPLVTILVTITVFPVLVTLAICWLRMRNIRARVKRITDWVSENKTMPGRYTTNN